MSVVVYDAIILHTLSIMQRSRVVKLPPFVLGTMPSAFFGRFNTVLPTWHKDSYEIRCLQQSQK